MKEPNLTKLTDEAVAALLALPEQGKRAASYGMSLLNKNPRSIRPIKRRFIAPMERAGFTPDFMKIAWNAVRDIAELEDNAE